MGVKVSPPNLFKGMLLPPTYLYNQDYKYSMKNDRKRKNVETNDV